MRSQTRESNQRIEILIAEDSPTQAQQLSYLLEESGFRVMVAKNGKDALVAALQYKPTLIITDIMMPEMDGYTLCKEIKSQKGLENVPVILLTSLSGAQDVIKGLGCGADSFIRKPYSERYLLSRIHYIITNRELRKGENVQIGIEIELGGQKHFITSERQQILDLLISTYEDAVYINEELIAKQKELENTNHALQREIDERRQAEEKARELNAQLLAANKELEAFSYSVSHDLRAPLRSIDGFSYALLEDYEQKLDDQARDSLYRIRKSTERMGQLIDDLLNLSRLTRTEINRQPVDLSLLAEDIGMVLQKNKPGREVKFVNAPGLVAEGDAQLLRIVLENLLGNAWKFTGNKPRTKIEFGATDYDGQRAYFVRDNGAGFDMAYADRVFAPFQRLHRDSEFEGTGIGLATVQRIIHRHGGRVWVQGAVDQGATVYFTLPQPSRTDEH